MSKRVLILFAHPALQKSRVHRRLMAAVRDLPAVTFHDLYERYPDLHIAVEVEQRLLTGHDAIVFQHPFYWYSSPAILKEWQDLVLEYGFAYGDGGTALMGKPMVTMLSTGGPEESYRAENVNRFSVRQLLAPFEQTARLCGMDYLPPAIIHGTEGLSDAELAAHADDYRRLVVALRDDTLDFAAARRCERLNANLDALIRPAAMP